MLAGAYNARHNLDAASDPRNRELALTATKYWPDNFNVLCRGGSDPPESASVRTAKSGSDAAPKSLRWGLETLRAVAAESLERTESQVARGGAGATLEARAKRLRRAVRELGDERDPCTWSIGNLEVEQVVERCRMGPQLVIASRNVQSLQDPVSGPGLLWGALLEHFGEAAGAKKQPALLFHLHGVLSGSSYFGHFALIFALVEFQYADGRGDPESKKKKTKARASSVPPTKGGKAQGGQREVMRKVLTARSYQGPRHWVDIALVWKWIYAMKFTGYEIRKCGK